MKNKSKKTRSKRGQRNAAGLFLYEVHAVSYRDGHLWMTSETENIQHVVAKATQYLRDQGYKNLNITRIASRGFIDA